MCAGATLFSGIHRLVVGARSAKLAEIRSETPRTYTAESLAEQMHMPLEVTRGVLQTMPKRPWRNTTGLCSSRISRRQPEGELGVVEGVLQDEAEKDGEEFDGPNSSWVGKVFPYQIQAGRVSE